MTHQSNDGVGLSHKQFTAAWQIMCGASPRYARHSAEDAEYIFSGVPIGFFNLVLLTGRNLSRDTLHRRAVDACAWSAAQGVPWLFVVTEETLVANVEAPAVLDHCGLVPIMPLTAMVVDAIAPATREASDDLQLTVPQDVAGLGTLLDVNSVAYNMPLDACKPVMSKTSFWSGHVPVLGHVRGQPASCAAVFMADGYRYVALVATDPAHQRRGYAEAAMRHALETAARQHGDVPTFLHATAAGRPIYERMGYQRIADHTVFMEKRFFAGH